MRKQIVRSHDALRAHSLTFKVLSFRQTTFFELAVYVATRNVHVSLLYTYLYNGITTVRHSFLILYK
jgi:hypothetical protein